MPKFTGCRWDWKYTEGGGGLVFCYGAENENGDMEFADQIAYVYHKDTEEGNANIRLITSAPGMYFMLKNLMFELERGNGSDPEYIRQAVPQIRDMLAEIDGEKYSEDTKEKIAHELLKDCALFISNGNFQPHNKQRGKNLCERISNFLAITENHRE